MAGTVQTAADPVPKQPPAAGEFTTGGVGELDCQRRWAGTGCGGESGHGRPGDGDQAGLGAGSHAARPIDHQGDGIDAGGGIGVGWMFQGAGKPIPKIPGALVVIPAGCVGEDHPQGDQAIGG